MKVSVPSPQKHSLEGAPLPSASYTVTAAVANKKVKSDEKEGSPRSSSTDLTTLEDDHEIKSVPETVAPGK